MAAERKRGLRHGDCPGLPQIIPDGFGGAIITWEDERSGNSDIYAQRVDENGMPQWTADGVAVCTTGDDQVMPRITPDGSGGAIIAWTDYSISYDSIYVYAQRVDANGVMQWVEGGVAVAGFVTVFLPPYYFNIEIASDGAGGAIITWTNDDDYFSSRPPWIEGVATSFAHRCDVDPTSGAGARSTSENL